MTLFQIKTTGRDAPQLAVNDAGKAHTIAYISAHLGLLEKEQTVLGFVDSHFGLIITDRLSAKHCQSLSIKQLDKQRFSFGRHTLTVSSESDGLTLSYGGSDIKFMPQSTAIKANQVVFEANSQINLHCAETHFLTNDDTDSATQDTRRFSLKPAPPTSRVQKHGTLIPMQALIQNETTSNSIATVIDTLNDLPHTIQDKNGRRFTVTLISEQIPKVRLGDIIDYAIADNQVVARSLLVKAKDARPQLNMQAQSNGDHTLQLGKLAIRFTSCGAMHLESDDTSLVLSPGGKVMFDSASLHFCGSDTVKLTAQQINISVGEDG